ncbi:PKD domain containing protein [Fermentimonas caenicola]|jgi:hypothetical protein|uniref:PKD domain containing protein n=1 Tax=Fermentimonas caenicola TaxID=1562970 RepID=A0A098BX37_9BACT|nr:DUF5074 domain-containing protein [Fermentimonas sp.]MDD3724193.1 DUF5074 domain-containing protein [Bacteroidales bacterium]MDD4009881.1 DUF5074 domain-containing protein [Fermentimonas sp.]CEA15210.1 PKD domain containing protein [Fermentimonas caenicola]SFU61385.1 PKD domain-containing protein [Porphyromonadaceae bacterium KHP3R9]
MKQFYFSLTLCIAVLFASCSHDDSIYTPTPPTIAIENLSIETSIAQEDTIYLKAKIESPLETTFTWSVNNVASVSDKVATDSIYKFVQKEVGDYTVTLTAQNADGETKTTVNLNVYGKFKYGTFVLNEGSAFQENSSLIFISPKGIVTDSAYWKVNHTELGNTSQDLFISAGKIYFIAQNGKSSLGNYPNDGKLIIANAETLKKEAVYDDELSVLSWPTHIAVLGNEVFIRDNKGIYSFNTSTKELKFIEGSNGAQKNRMAVAEGKVFVPANKSVLVLEAGKSEISHKIELNAAVSGVIKTSDNNIYISTTGTPNKISKINAKNYSVIKENEVSEGKLGAGWGATPGISAKGDTIYYGNATTKIYRHIFNTGKSEYLIDAKDIVEDAGMAYNNLAVHPISGEVYQTTIKAYGMDFLKNNISVFNFSKSESKLRVNYKNHTHFPAGIFFTYDFE